MGAIATRGLVLPEGKLCFQTLQLSNLRTNPDALHGACIWGSLSTFHGASIASTGSRYNPGQGRSFSQQPPRCLRYRRKVEQREVPDLETAGCPDGGERTLDARQSRRPADRQEFKIHLGSRWSKGEGFVQGNDINDDSDSDSEMA